MPTHTLDELAPLLLWELSSTLHALGAQEIENLANAILKTQRVVLEGKGRTEPHMYAFAMPLMHLGLKMYVVGDVTTPSFRSEDLVIIGSGSGGIASLVGHSQRASTLGARVALLSGTYASPIESNAEITIHIPPASPRTRRQSDVASGQHVRTLFEQSLGLVLDMMVILLMEHLGESTDEIFDRHENLE